MTSRFEVDLTDDSLSRPLRFVAFFLSLLLLGGSRHHPLRRPLASPTRTATPLADDEGWSDYIAQAPDLIGSHLWCRLTLTHFSLQVDLSIFVKLEDESTQSFCSAESARRL